MSRDTWNLIKKSKNLNASIYRKGLFALNISLVLSGVLGLLLFYRYLTEPERGFYATSGIAPPVQLQPLFTPNYSSNALLPPDPPAEPEERLIPQ